MSEQAFVAECRGHRGQDRAIHTDRDCPNLDRAGSTRPATDGEIDSRRWCGTCTDTGGQLDNSGQCPICEATMAGSEVPDHIIDDHASEGVA